MSVSWKAGAAKSDGDGGATVVISVETEGGRTISGEVGVTRRGRLKTELPMGEGAPALPDALKGCVGFALGGLDHLAEVAADAARAAKLIPAADPGRSITSEPRILTFRDGYCDDANSEGCVVSVDDPAAVKATGKYRGPPDCPPNLDFVACPSGLPGRKYLALADAKTGLPAAQLKFQPGSLWVNDLDPSLGGTLVLALADWPTVWPSWQDAEDAIREAHRRGILAPRHAPVGAAS